MDRTQNEEEYNLAVSVQWRVSTSFFSQSTREEINPGANHSSGNWGAKAGEEVLLFARGWQSRK